MLVCWALFFATCVAGQSFELMPGTERIFVDAQFLQYFDAESKISLFSRARATSGYEEKETDLFTGSYLNYTTSSGFGTTLLGRISSSNSAIDTGIHYFKANQNIIIYALAAINVGDVLLYSWFSIFRYTRHLKSDWQVYTSLELFSAFARIGHLSSVQRIRLGVGKHGYHFGLAVNLNESRMTGTDVNPGIFFRRQF